MQGKAFSETVVMVTGAAGNLGAAVVNQLVHSGAKIAAVEWRHSDADGRERFQVNQILDIAGIDLSDLSACQDAVFGFNRIGRW